MKKVLVLTMMVAAFWAGLTIANDGLDGLTGALGLSRGADSEVSESRPSLPRRLGAVVDAEMKKRDEDLSRRLDHLGEL